MDYLSSWHFSTVPNSVTQLFPDPIGKNFEERCYKKQHSQKSKRQASLPTSFCLLEVTSIRGMKEEGSLPVFIYLETKGVDQVVKCKQ